MIKNDKLRNTVGYYLLFICLGFGLGITGPALPSLATQTGSSFGSVGSLFLVGAFGYTLGTFVGGRFFDLTPQGHRVLGLSQLVSAALLAAIPLAGSLPLLLVIVFIGGIPNGILNTGANTLLIWTHGEKAGPYVNGLHFAFGLGAFLAPTIYAQVLSLGGNYQDAYWVLAVTAIPIAGFILFLPSSFDHPSKHDDNHPRSDNLGQFLPRIIVAMLFLFFYVGAELTFGNWIFTYTLTLNIANVTQSAYLTSGFWLAFTIGRAISIPMATRFKPRNVLPVAFLGGLSALALSVMAPNSINILWGATLALGLFMAPIWPTGYSLAAQSIKLTATISSIILLGDSLGGIVLPWVTGRVIERYGAQTMPWLVFSSLALTLLVFLIMLQQHNKTS